MTGKKRGGARKGAGAPSSSDLKISISIGVEESKIRKVGGVQKCKSVLKTLINKHVESLPNENASRTA